MDREKAVKSLTREGLFAYFDQMSNESGQILTTADWLADTAMLVAHEVRKEAREAAGQSDAWVSVSERLPEKDGWYLWHVKGMSSASELLWFEAGYRQQFKDGLRRRFDKWLSVPSPYEPPDKEVTE